MGIVDKTNETQRLKAQLEALLFNAHENQKKLERFEAIEFKLMAAESIEDLLRIIGHDYMHLFKLDACTLLLEDSDLSLRRLIPEATFESIEYNFLTLLNFPMELEKLQYMSSKICTDTYQSSKHQWLMDKPGIASIAILPLIRRGKKIGVFCCGSRDINRFQSHASSDFLQRLSFIMAVCVENALNLERLKQSTFTDPLTRVRNRRFFDQRLPEELNRRDRSRTSISCVFLDIDHFKSVNDNYGHGVGDDVLRQVAQRVQSVLRTHDVLARYGGEEFAVLLPDTGHEEAMMVAQRIINAVNRSRVVVDKNVLLTITISAGVSTIESKQCFEDIRELGLKLLASADQALYDAKEMGRNRAINAGLLALTSSIDVPATVSGHN